MNVIHHYSHICIAVLKDFSTFGTSLWKSLALYLRATYEVAIELWDEFAPTHLLEHASLPSFSVPEYEIEESPRLLLFLLIAAPVVLFLGTLWFLYMLVFLGA